MQEVRIGAVYVFESAVYGGPLGGLYRHEVLGYEEESRERGARYLVRAWQIEVTDRPGQYSTKEGPVVAWHDADALHRWYATRWS